MKGLGYRVDSVLGAVFCKATHLISPITGDLEPNIFPQT